MHPFVWLGIAAFALYKLISTPDAGKDEKNERETRTDDGPDRSGRTGGDQPRVVPVGDCVPVEVKPEPQPVIDEPKTPTEPTQPEPVKTDKEN